MLSLLLSFVVGVFVGGAGGYLFGARVRATAAVVEADVKKL